MPSNQRFIIVGGNAAGMSAASRIRRTLPDAQITVYEKSPHVSYGACGLPYYISDDIKTAEKLIAISAEDFQKKRNIEVQTGHQAVSFDPKKKTLQIEVVSTGEQKAVIYDKLIISTGAGAIIPDIPGKKLQNVFALRTMEDGIKLREFIDKSHLENAVIVGGGYIGLEMAEALTKRGMKVTVVEKLDRLMANVDPDISGVIEEELKDQNCTIYKSNGLEEISGNGKTEKVLLSDGTSLSADLVVLAIGVKANVEFARSGGVSIGRTGAIEVSANMRTNIHNVFAAGDCAEAKNLVTNKADFIPLGTTANKQGRIAGDNAAGVRSAFRGIVGTAVVKVFDLEVARTGITSTQADNLRIPFKTIMIDSKSRAGYYPDPQKIKVKLIFRTNDGRLIGAQMVGKEGVAKRIDTLAVALQKKMTVEEISELDLSYAPPFAPVWDPILIAANQAVKLVRG